MNIRIRFGAQTCQQWLMAALCVLVSLAGVTPVSASETDTTYTLSSMPIVKMRDEYNKTDAAVRSRMSREASTYIDAISKVLNNAAAYDAQAKRRIDDLKDELAKATEPRKRYELCAALYEEYSHQSFKPAFTAAQQCEQIGHETGDYDLVAQAIIYKVEILIKGGFFREASETLATVDAVRCSETVKVNRLIAAFNLEFENGFYFPRHLFNPNLYLQRMNDYYEQMRRLVPAESWILDDMNVKMNFNKRNYAEAVRWSKRLLAKLAPSSDYYPTALGNLGYNYMGLGDYANAACYISQSAIENIKRGAKDYAAARKIAEVAFITGDITRSYMLINVAMHNAETFHSRYRYAEIAASYPKIDNDLYVYTQKQQTRLLVGFVVLAVVVVLLCGAIYMMVRQARMLHRQKELIEHHVESLSDKSRQIEEINVQLLEAGRIKEVVLGQLIMASANHQSAMEKLRKEVLRRLTIKDYDGLRNVFDQQRGEAFDVLYPIDQVLLMLFPDFPEHFNSLLREENRVMPRRDERFTTEMRIFALIRLGITKNDDLARSLNYSVNTIKSYKTRVLNAALYDKDEFYRRLMA